MSVEPTGCAVVMYSWTMARRMADLRSSSTAPACLGGRTGSGTPGYRAPTSRRSIVVPERALSASARTAAGPRRARRDGRASAPGTRHDRSARAHGSPGASTSASSGTQRRMYAPSGSNFSDCAVGLNTRKYGAASVPVPAVHCQPWLFDARSPSTRWPRKWRAPHHHGRWRSLTRKLAVTIRTRLCIQPMPSSWRMPASTSGKPVVPARPPLEAAARRGVGVERHRVHRRVEVVPRRLRSVQEHVGVELAPDQLGGEAIRRRDRGGRRGRRGAGSGGPRPSAGRRTSRSWPRGRGGCGRRRSGRAGRRGTRCQRWRAAASPTAGSSGWCSRCRRQVVGGDVGRATPGDVGRRPAPVGGRSCRPGPAERGEHAVRRRRRPCARCRASPRTANRWRPRRRRRRAGARSPPRRAGGRTDRRRG